MYEKCQVGVFCYHIVVVGDGKSYDLVIKLKAEHGTALNWVLPYPDDWHILKNVLPIFIKLYFDAGLKQLTIKFHHGSTLRILTDCSKCCVTHRFLLEAWEAILTHQVKAFLSYISSHFKTILMI